MGQLLFKQQYSTLKAQSYVLIRNSIGQYLVLVQNKSISLIGGTVIPPNSYFESIIQTTKQQTNVDIKLEGILRTEQSINKTQQCFKVIFYATPLHKDQIIDVESNSSLIKWIDYQNLEDFCIKLNGQKDNELIKWAHYVEKGGIIMPLSFIAKEGSKPKKDQSFIIEQQTFKIKQI